MQYEVPLPVNMNHDMSNAGHYSQNLYVPNGAGRIKSEGGSERGVSPHTSEQSSRYSSQTPQTSNMSYTQMASHLSNDMRYPSPSQLSQPGNMNTLMQQHAYHPNGPADQTYQQPSTNAMGNVPQGLQADQNQMDAGKINGNSLPKAFACTTCQKGFARRSDLARHERIHSGVRPHVCDHPGCNKQFIQRSALTVHSRVHTGEKPHMCERCGKPFSDSSSLARHRRIHSGKRPYQCPYPHCQKTFTRRTTLTRHQNHHTGTIEESEAATAAALAGRGSMQHRGRGTEDENDFSTDGKSPMPSDRPSSVSPAAGGMGNIPQLSRQPSDFYLNAMNGGMAAMPAHLRNEMQPTSRSQSPAQYGMANGAGRPGLTSNPTTGYNPPQILEPPTSNGQQNGSGNNSPHMSASMGWQSPHTSITPNQSADYPYPDPNSGYGVGAVNNVAASQIYYPQAGVSRPQSTGPLDYHNSLRGQEMWAQHQQ